MDEAANHSETTSTFVHQFTEHIMSASLNLVLLFASQALAGPLLLPRQDVASSIVASTSFVATSSAAAVAEAEATPVEAAVADTAVVADAAEADVLVASECTLTTFPPATVRATCI